MSEVIVWTSSEFPRRAATWVADRVIHACAGNGGCSLSLCGGSSPRPVYTQLARPPLSILVPWRKVFVYFGDERAVPPDHSESNYRMARETLLDHVDLKPTRVHRMEAEDGDLDAAARRYEQLHPAELDVLLLGMGGDGHTASLFPHSPALYERERRVVPVTGPRPPVRRLTVTPAVIAAAREVAVLITGHDKAAMVARALEGGVDVAGVPVQLARGGTWLLDEPAASVLTSLRR